MKTTDLETSKQLAAALEWAGYEYDSYFTYYTGIIEGTTIGTELIETRCGNPANTESPAFTMCELWDMLPNKKSWKFELGISKSRNTESYAFADIGKYFHDIEDINPCNALARLAIWCIENGHELNLKRKK